MRTTVTLDQDVERRLREIMKTKDITFKTALNESVRIGANEMLHPPKPKPFKQKTYPMGLKRGLSYDNIEELLDIAEGPLRR